MNISDMHVWFRQYAQQMGMQNVRAILPEQIDILINTSITDTVNQIIRENVGITNDRVITDNSKIGQINALKHLYKVREIPFVSNGTELEMTVNVLDATTSEPVSTSFAPSKVKLTINDISKTITYNPVSGLFGSEFINEFKKEGIKIKTCDCSIRVTGTTEEPLVQFQSTLLIDDPNITSYNAYFTFLNSSNEEIANYDKDSSGITEHEVVIDNFYFENKNHYNGLISLREGLQEYLFLVDFSIDYSDASVGIGRSVQYLNNFKSNLFPIRLIDDAYLADTLNDFILKPRLRSPIAVIVNNNLQIYLGKLNGNTNIGYFLDNNLVPDIIRIAYIAKPAIVKYSEDINGQNVDCDLPDYMHVDILKHAVDLYRAAISGSIAASQASEQTQNQENVRNNYRNEGYQ